MHDTDMNQDKSPSRAVPLPGPDVGSELIAATIGAERIVVFGRFPNPSYDYYLSARVSRPEMPPSYVCDERETWKTWLSPRGTYVIICRYASPAVLLWIWRNVRDFAGVAFFLDDDIQSVILSGEASLRYKFRLFAYSLLPRLLLKRHLSVTWASTPYLATKLGGKSCGVEVLLPAPPRSKWSSAPLQSTVADPSIGELTIAYHATAIHVQEHEFLAPIINEVLASRAHVHFEVFGGRRVERLWKESKRVTFRRPVGWKEYCEEGLTRTLDIMVVPLAPNPVNKSRSSTKRIDVARFRAAAIFSASEAYGYGDDSGELILPYDAKLWISAILTLIDDRSFRAHVAAATVKKVEALSPQ